MLIDTHCHLTFPELTNQVATVIRRAHESGVARMITVATSTSDARDALALLANQPSVCMAAGIHPHEAARITDDDLAALTKLHESGADEAVPGRLVAVGETGLDFHYDFAPPDVQESIFRAQLDLAVRVNRPVVIHARHAEDRVCGILAEYPTLRDRVVFHCFSGSLAQATRIIEMGLWISFTGVVTFKNAGEIRAAARMVPADRIMVETDAPYLAPVPHRKVRPNEPALMIHTARFLAELRNQEFDGFARQTTRNAERFFGLPEA